jgi:hypothetical protein
MGKQAKVQMKINDRYLAGTWILKTALLITFGSFVLNGCNPTSSQAAKDSYLYTVKVGMDKFVSDSIITQPKCYLINASSSSGQKYVEVSTCSFPHPEDLLYFEVDTLSAEVDEGHHVFGKLVFAWDKPVLTDKWKKEFVTRFSSDQIHWKDQQVEIAIDFYIRGDKNDYELPGYMSSDVYELKFTKIDSL